ncbi:unnamed protein product [Somion occarium]|uniref:Uncharacterized protein n=1 Tax=Somion occarium TaxID=3059160 RepID=A0ABP1D1C5_9APHY
MRDIVQEEQIHPLGLTGSDDYDYDYEVYYFWPSISPHVVSADDIEAFDLVEWPATTQWSLLNDNHPARPISPVISLSYTTTTEFAFPTVEDEAGLSGYSRFFRSGFRCASHRLTRRFDNVLHALQKRLRATKRKLVFRR